MSGSRGLPSTMKYGNRLCSSIDICVIFEKYFEEIYNDHPISFPLKSGSGCLDIVEICVFDALNQIYVKKSDGPDLIPPLVVSVIGMHFPLGLDSVLPI